MAATAPSQPTGSAFKPALQSTTTSGRSVNRTDEGTSPPSSTPSQTAKKRGGVSRALPSAATSTVHSSSKHSDRNTSTQTPPNTSGNAKGGSGASTTSSSTRRGVFPCVMCFRNPTSGEDNISVTPDSTGLDDSWKAVASAGEASEDRGDGKASSGAKVAALVSQVSKSDASGRNDKKGRRPRRGHPSGGSLTASQLTVNHYRLNIDNDQRVDQTDQTDDRETGYGVLSPTVDSSSAALASTVSSIKGPFLGPQAAEDVGKKTLVLDLDETLVHSCFRPVSISSFSIPVEIDGYIHRIYVCKRPWVDEFLATVAKKYEVVIFTASLRKYADPLIDRLDPSGNGKWRLFREACTVR
eukprot:GHVN01030305.1.p1 GENE.GHVN01030305.1~~GHVN01030305.1.p1  ORF type:complete len:355 (+),score=59.56 GHVN01030305.1:251-1315(+)